jgi:hypothetical protein
LPAARRAGYTSPENITSWGHFILKKEGQLTQGIGFNSEFPNPRDKGKTVILPVSAQVEYQGVRQKGEEYLDPAPHYPPPREPGYGLQPIALNNQIRPAAPEAWNVGREPEAVMLIADAQLGRRPAQARRARAHQTFLPFGAPLLPAATGFQRLYYPFSGFLLSDPFGLAVEEEDLLRFQPPAAVVSGLLGLPLLYLFGRRRRAVSAPAADEAPLA